MNLDFSAQPLFSWYVVLLIFSGLVMLVMGALNTSGLSKGWRVVNALFGLGFLGYGVYLGFIFQGDSYIIFFKALFVPIAMIVNFFRSMSMRQKVRTAQTAQAAMYGAQPPAGPPQQQAPGAAGYGYPQPPAGPPQQPAPGTYPQQPAPGGYPQAPAPGGYPQQGQGGYPPQGPGQNG